MAGYSQLHIQQRTRYCFFIKNESREYIKCLANIEYDSLKKKKKEISKDYRIEIQFGIKRNWSWTWNWMPPISPQVLAFSEQQVVSSLNLNEDEREREREREIRGVSYQQHIHHKATICFRIYWEVNEIRDVFCLYMINLYEW